MKIEKFAWGNRLTTESYAWSSKSSSPSPLVSRIARCHGLLVTDVFWGLLFFDDVVDYSKMKCDILILFERFGVAPHFLKLINKREVLLHLFHTVVLLVADNHNLMRRWVGTVLAHHDGYANPTMQPAMRTINVRKKLTNFLNRSAAMSPIDNSKLCGGLQNIFGAHIFHQLL